MRALPNLAAVALLLLVAACGTKGELVMPPGPPPKTLMDEWFPPGPPPKPVLDQWLSPTPPPPAAPAAKDSKPDGAADKQ